MNREDDKSLLSRIAAGDTDALKELYLRYSKKVFNTSLGYLQDRNEAEEITQDVFLSVFNGASGFRGSSAVSTWIYRITVNKSLDRYRSLRRKKRLLNFIPLLIEDQIEEIVARDFDHPGVETNAKDEMAMIFGEINRLPEKQRTAFILVYIEGLHQKEIAEIMKTSVKAVESLLQRAKVKLRERLVTLDRTKDLGE